MNHAILPVAVHIFFIKKGKIFLIKRINTGFQDGKWSVPAGRLEINETIMQAAIREAKEEVGAKIKANNLKKILIMSHRDKRGERLYCFFICRKWENNLEKIEVNICSDARWFNIKKLPNNMVKHVRYALDLIVKGYDYAEFGY